MLVTSRTTLFLFKLLSVFRYPTHPNSVLPRRDCGTPSQQGCWGISLQGPEATSTWLCWRPAGSAPNFTRNCQLVFQAGFPSSCPVVECHCPHLVLCVPILSSMHPSCESCPHLVISVPVFSSVSPSCHLCPHLVIGVPILSSVSPSWYPCVGAQQPHLVPKEGLPSHQGGCRAL